MWIRPGHSCDYAVTVGGILLYEALGELADVAYTTITNITSKNLGRRVPLVCVVARCAHSFQ